MRQVDDDKRAAHAAYVRRHRQANLEACRKKERIWAAAKPSRRPEARRARALRAAFARYAQCLAEANVSHGQLLLAIVIERRDRGRQKARHFAESERGRAYRLEYGRAYARKRKDDFAKKHRAYYAANREAIKAKVKAYRQANPDARRAVKHAERARYRQAGGTFTRADLWSLYVEQDGCCFYCGHAFGVSGYHVEHRTPIVRGGTNSPENLALACPSCNLAKGRKTDDEFIAARHVQS